jgi:hypothetical protein
VVTTEHTINDALASALRHGRQAWRAPNIIRSENTGLLKSSAGRQPDILVLEPHVSPVVIETEVLPAVTVEPEARARLGESIKATGHLLLVQNNAAVIVCAVAAGALTASFVTMFRLERGMR